MSDIYRHWLTGDPVNGISAEFLNRLVEMAKAWPRLRANLPGGNIQVERATTDIRIRNESGAILNQYSIVGRGTSVIVPTLDETTFFFGPGVFESGAPSQLVAFGILQEPATIGGLAKTSFSGHSWVRLFVKSTAHQYAEVIEGDYTRMQSASSGRAGIIWLGEEEGGEDDERWALVSICCNHGVQVGSGSGDPEPPIETDCCPGVELPASLCMTFEISDDSNGGDGSGVLVFQPSAGFPYWSGTVDIIFDTPVLGIYDGMRFFMALYCLDGSWHFEGNAQWLIGSEPQTGVTYTVGASVAEATCDPFELTGTAGTSALGGVYWTFTIAPCTCPSPPTVTENLGDISISATGGTITGTNFGTDAGAVSIIFTTLGATGHVTSAASTTLDFVFDTPPTSTGALRAIVVVDGCSSEPSVQVATIVSATAGCCDIGDVPPDLDFTKTDAVGCYMTGSSGGVFTPVLISGTLYYWVFSGDMGCSGTEARIRCVAGVPTLLIESPGGLLNVPPEAGYICETDGPYAFVFLVDDGDGNSCTITVTEA